MIKYIIIYFPKDLEPYDTLGLAFNWLDHLTWDCQINSYNSTIINLDKIYNEHKLILKIKINPIVWRPNKLNRIKSSGIAIYMNEKDYNKYMEEHII
jgi:hypothetical protein